MNRDWLRELEEQLRLDETFCAQMDSQLGAAFTAATGETLSRFHLLPPWGRRFEVDRNGDTFSVSGRLLNIDLVFPVRVAWSLRGAGHEFRWLELPADRIRTELEARRAIEFGTQFEFELCIRDPVWPHVDLTLQGEAGFDPRQAEAVIHRRVAAQEEADGGGVVHRVGAMQKLDGGRYRVRIDFGSTGLEFMTRLLKDLETCLVKRVTLDSSPETRGQ